MTTSILDDTKKILGLAANYTAFDLDVLTHINSAFSTLHQLGVGPSNGFSITKKDDLWSSYSVTQTTLGLVRTYVFLKVRLLFDPPATSFHLEAAKGQLAELEWRLNHNREWELDPVDPRTRG